MDIVAALWSFGVAVGLLTLTPGPDTALILRTAGLGHRRCAWGAVLGIRTGTFLWGACTSLGVAAPLTASRFAYTCLRWAGAAYLVRLGGRVLAATWRRGAAEPVAPPGTGTGRTGTGGEGPGALSGGFRQGAFTNPLNPRWASSPSPSSRSSSRRARPTSRRVCRSPRCTSRPAWSGRPCWSPSHAACGARRPRARRVLDRATGTGVAAFGVRLAAEG